MKARVKFVLIQLLVVLLSMSVAFPQESMPVPQQSTAVPNRPTVTQQELDQMLAPIALYPDALLSQILMASTYPLEVIQAARWSKANPTLKGDEAVKAVDGNNWEPSVKSLVAFPQILTMMDENLNWMERLGDAFLAQEAQVMDTVQHLRQKAYEAGNLKSSNEVRVEQQGQTIVVEPAGDLRPILRPESRLWAVVVAGVSAGLLGTVARLLRVAGIRSRVCVGRRDHLGCRIFLRRFRLAASPRQHRDREQLLLPEQCGEGVGARSGSSPGSSLSECGLASTIWTHKRVP